MKAELARELVLKRLTEKRTLLEDFKEAASHRSDYLEAFKCQQRQVYLDMLYYELHMLFQPYCEQEG